jgi:hypothetical protein
LGIRQGFRKRSCGCVLHHGRHGLVPKPPGRVTGILWEFFGWPTGGARTCLGCSIFRGRGANSCHLIDGAGHVGVCFNANATIATSFR